MRDARLDRSRRPRRWSLLVAAMAGGVALLCLAIAGILAGARAQPTGDATAQSAVQPPATVAQDGGGGGATSPAGVPLPPAVTTPRPTVKIVFKVIPPNRATVSWGKKKLGLIKPRGPLVVERPRDSGPLDVVVRAEGCLPVQTRAYTFTDTTVAVKVTPVAKKNTIYGYREEIPPDADGGVPAPAAGGRPPPDGGVLAPPEP